MPATATLNVRLSEDLKERGMQVLDREGVSVSDAVRELFCELEKEQTLPSFMKDKATLMAHAEIQRKRDALHSMVGAISVPTEFDAREAWRAHLEAKQS